MTEIEREGGDHVQFLQLKRVSYLQPSTNKFNSFFYQIFQIQDQGRPTRMRIEETHNRKKTKLNLENVSLIFSKNR